MTTPATPAPLPAEAVEAAEGSLRALLEPWLSYEVFGSTLASQIHTAAVVAVRDAAPHLVAAAYGQGRDDEANGEPFVAAPGWSETEIRIVPESAVAEAVATERERCAQLADKHGVQYLTGVNGLDQCAEDCEHSRPSNRPASGRHWHPFSGLLRTTPKEPE